MCVYALYIHQFGTKIRKSKLKNAPYKKMN